MARVPSPLQQAILDAVTSSNDSLLIEARAGSGKTSTLEMIANVLRGSACFLAFNKSIATELSARLPFPASTYHSLAFRAVGRALTARNRGRRCTVDANKVGNLFDDNYGRPYLAVRGSVLKLVGLMKAQALMPDAPQDALTSILSHFDIEWDDDNVSDSEVCDMARRLLTLNNADTYHVDFDDMLYFVVVFNVKLDTFDTVLVDEAQDTNDVQRTILRRLMRPSSRLIAVGDPAQAIYGFRGASHDSMDRIAADFSARRMPLSISYRCPRLVVQAAQKYVPDIMPRDNAPDGTILYPSTWKLTDFLPDDLLVCRNTAPLIQVCYRLISRRIPAKIMGREIGRGLTSLVKKLAGRTTTLDALPDKLMAYQDREVSTALARKQESKAQAITDKCESILALIDSMTEDDRARGITGLCDIIEAMFSDNGPRVTTLATVHKAKGLEAPRVFIVDSHLMPSKYARQEWQLQQEYNLAYVAITRALDTLVYVDSKRIGATD